MQTSYLKHFIFLIAINLCGFGLVINAAVILQYHHVSESTPASTSISPKLFEKHLNYLEKNNFQVWSLPHLITQLKNRNKIPDKVVVITFDDAYQSIYNHAYPMLKKRKFPFTIFSSTNPIKKSISDELKKNATNNSAGFMDWQQLKKMADNGGTIANHTLSHVHLVRQRHDESNQQWNQRIQSEILEAEKLIEQNIGYSKKLLAYPYGEYTHRLKELVASLGYTAFGQQSGAVSEHHDFLALPRFPMTDNFGEMSQFKIKVNSLPLWIKSAKPKEHLITKPEHSFKGLTLQFPLLEMNIKQFACYISGHGKVKLESEKLDTGFEVKMVNPLKLSPGRSRINCTAPSTNPKTTGRFYWFSYSWMKTLASGEWYPEN